MRKIAAQSLLLFAISCSAYALEIPNGKLAIEAGLFRTNQGDAQDISINGLVGDHFTVQDGTQNNGLVGIGYYLPFMDNTLDVGLNVFYLAKTTIKGSIIQENLYENLDYRYDVIQAPIYLDAKKHFPMSESYGFTIDLAVGINIMNLHNYHDEPSDGSTSLPDDAFKSQSNVLFSGSVGLGIELCNLLYHQPIEIGYRFFYLGESSLPGRVPEIEDLETGHAYAHALVGTIMFDM